MLFFLTMSILATFAAVFLEDFTILGNSPQQWRKVAVGVSDRNAFGKRNTLATKSSSSGMKVLGTQTAASTKLFPCISLQGLVVF